MHFSLEILYLIIDGSKKKGKKYVGKKVVLRSDYANLKCNPQPKEFYILRLVFGCFIVYNYSTI